MKYEYNNITHATNQVCSCELAKKLNELGVRKDALYWWTPNLVNDTPIITTHPYNEKAIPAYTAAELSDLLNKVVKQRHEIHIVFAVKVFHLKLYVQDGDSNGDFILYELDYTNLADAFAQMLILLIENDLITINEVNNNERCMASKSSS